MSRFFVLAMIATVVPSAASAQILGTDPSGFPMRQWLVSLPGNTDVQLSTGDLVNLPGYSPANSILSIRPNGNHLAVAGSDGCGANVGPSCFTFHTSGTTGSSVSYVVMLRGYRSSTPGQTTVWYQPAGAPAWTQITAGATTFGGSVAHVTHASGSTHVRYDTLMRPGGNTDHLLWLAETNEWRVRRVAAVGSGPVGNLARMDFNPTSLALIGTFRLVFGGTAGAGPIRVVRNEPFNPPVDDRDGDGLSRLLELSLDSCDSTSDPNPSPGFSCAALPGCSPSAGNPVCDWSLDDSDHDGIPDYAEVYGYDDPLLWIPLWGADPAHADVFVEIDALDQVDTTPGVLDPVCDGFASLNAIGGDVSVPFAARFAAAYAGYPASSNPNGLPGLSVHLDVGLANPNLLDTTWGNWGGGNTCVIQDGVFNGLGELLCPGYGNYYDGAPAGCTAAVAPSRRWAFFWALDAGVPGAAPGQGGGRAYYARDLAHHVHELGHCGHLFHSGPQGSTAERSNDFGAVRPNYISRMNYRFQDTGLTTGANASDWAAITFSSSRLGNSAMSLAAGAADETCPFGVGFDPSYLALATTGGGGYYRMSAASLVLGGTTPGCWDIDWNEDAAAPGPASYDRVYSNYRRDARWSRLGTARTARSSPDMAVAADTLLYASVEPSAGSWRVALRADGTGDCNAEPIGLRSAGYEASNAEFASSGSYPGCYRPGTPYYPQTTTIPIGSLTADAVAVVGASVAGASGPIPGVVLVTSQAGTIRWTRLGVARNTGVSEEATFTALAANVAVPGAVAASMVVGEREPDLVRLPATGEVLLSYLDTGGTVRVAGLPSGGSAFRTAVPATTGVVAITSRVAPSLVEIQGQIWMATTDPSDAIQLWRLGGTSATNIESRAWELRATLGATTTFRPTLAAMRDREDFAGGAYRLGVLFLLNTSHLWWFVSDPSAFDTFSFPAFPWAGGAFGLGSVESLAPAALFDTRSYVAWDLRLLRETPIGCAGCAGTCTNGSCLIGGDPVSIEFTAPFARGPAVGTFTDYDDWRGLAWGFCESLAGANGVAPAGWVRACGPQPIFSEPLPGGGMSIVAAPAWNDSASYPHLYEPRPASICAPAL